MRLQCGVVWYGVVVQCGAGWCGVVHTILHCSLCTKHCELCTAWHYTMCTLCHTVNIVKSSILQLENTVSLPAVCLPAALSDRSAAQSAAVGEHRCWSAPLAAAAVLQPTCLWLHSSNPPTIRHSINKQYLKVNQSKTAFVTPLRYFISVWLAILSDQLRICDLSEDAKYLKKGTVRVLQLLLC